MRIVLAIATGIGLSGVAAQTATALLLQPDQSAHCRFSSYWLTSNKLQPVIPTAAGNIAGSDVILNGVKVFLTDAEQQDTDSIAWWRDDGVWAKAGYYTEALVKRVNEGTAPCPGSDAVKYNGDANNGIDYVVDDTTDTGQVVVIEAKQMTNSLGMTLGSSISGGLQLSRRWITYAAQQAQEEDATNEGARLVLKAIGTRDMLVPIAAGVYPRDYSCSYFYGCGYNKGGLAYFRVDADNPR